MAKSSFVLQIATNGIGEGIKSFWGMFQIRMNFLENSRIRNAFDSNYFDAVTDFSLVVSALEGRVFGLLVTREPNPIAMAVSFGYTTLRPRERKSL